MDQRRTLFLAGVLGVLIIAIIIGTIVYLSRSFQGTNSNSTVVTSTPSPSTSSIPAFSATPSARNPADSNPNFKTYSGGGFQVQYPSSWGLLTCANSQSFEFDPGNSTDQVKVVCNSAVKPITFLVHKVSCSGQTIKLGNISVIKSVDTSLGRTDYRWCTKTNPMLDISHRYSQSGGVATSTTDLSSQVEGVVSTIYFGGGS